MLFIHFKLIQSGRWANRVTSVNHLTAHTVKKLGLPNIQPKHGVTRLAQFENAANKVLFNRLLENHTL